MGTSPPKQVVDLVEHFDRDRKAFQSAEYKEESLRKEFLDPFFESLGWDVSNKAGLTEVFKPVIPAGRVVTRRGLTPNERSMSQQQMMAVSRMALLE